MTPADQKCDELRTLMQDKARVDVLQGCRTRIIGEEKGSTAMGSQLSDCVKIYHDAVQRLSALTPYKPYLAIAEMMTTQGYPITESSVRAKVSGERPFGAEELGVFFKVCQYPEGFLRFNELFCGVQWNSKEDQF